MLLALLLLACDPTAPQGGAPDVAAAGDCDPAAALPAQLRLLTRREYEATVADLFGFAGAACEADTDCILTEQSCEYRACAADPCTTVTFLLEGYSGAGTVSVAGSFNDWSATGLALTHDEAADRWWAKTTLDPGHHSYKFVVDGVWIVDPENPNSESDGLGGANSVIEVDCAGDSESAGRFTERFPVESRPDEFPFDNHAASGLVTATAAEAHLDAAQAVAAQALAAPGAWLPCDPADGACLNTFLDGVAPRIFRRPLSAVERARYATLATQGEDPEDGLSLCLEAMLASPSFLYRSEIGDGAVLTAYEAATALSYALWGSTPDDALLEAAAAGALDEAEGRRTEAVRLLNDPRAAAHIGDFGVMWLGVDVIATATRRDDAVTPLTASLRAAMIDEAAAYTAHVFYDGGRTASALYTTPYTFAGPELAALYGQSSAAEGTRIDWPADERAGLLGLSGVLASLAHSDQSAPVLRGVWVRQRLLCQTLPAPPADIPAAPEASEGGTTRERFTEHTADPVCSSCHVYLDPVGFGFEHFDQLGRYRAADNGLPVDASGVIHDLEFRGAGTEAPFDGLPARGARHAQSPAAERCVVTQLGRFAAGAEAEDLCLTDDATAQLRETGDLRQALLRFVTDPAFLHRERAP